jgi:hypothetical protein
MSYTVQEPSFELVETQNYPVNNGTPYMPGPTALTNFFKNIKRGGQLLGSILGEASEPMSGAIITESQAVGRRPQWKRKPNYQVAHEKIEKGEPVSYNLDLHPAGFTAKPTPFPRGKHKGGRHRGAAFSFNTGSVVADLVTIADTFNVTRFAVNPGDAELFPQLKGVARNFVHYTLRAYVEYDSIKGTQTNGAVAIGFSSNPNRATPTNLRDFSQLEHCEIHRLYDVNERFRIPCLGKKLVRDEGAYGGAPTAELEPYDNGVLFVATFGSSVSEDCGLLTVDANVELSEFEPADPSFLQITCASNISTSNVFGDAALTGYAGDININRLNENGEVSSRLCFHESGRFLMTLTWQADVSDTLGLSVTGGTILAQSTPPPHTAHGRIVVRLLVEIPLVSLGSNLAPNLQVTWGALTNAVYFHCDVSVAPSWLTTL